MLGKRFGDKEVVAAGLALMALGGGMVALAPNWTVLVWGRLVAGVGGILINVVMSKMVADWFAGKELATAMAIFVNSWPVGTALGLIVLPLTAELGGFTTSLVVVATYPALSLIALVILYEGRTFQRASVLVSERTWPAREVLISLTLSAVIWSLFNIGLGTVFGFGALMLVEKGWDNPSAAGVTSIVLWVVECRSVAYWLTKPGAAAQCFCLAS
jgi:MFS family permease